ncbi:hypothetical protein NDU88_008651 [Pleurodeles waltl]|uniref:Uncharacterized protein n=1 Tax=Pleurodeles waltl TaxID=8319 RepID=A0AAV7NWQ5_PLEWA|nr:hypothetical protein NDU88_008651 [Pleurodeles waltl]
MHYLLLRREPQVYEQAWASSEEHARAVGGRDLAWSPRAVRRHASAAGTQFPLIWLCSGHLGHLPPSLSRSANPLGKHRQQLLKAG